MGSRERSIAVDRVAMGLEPVETDRPLLAYAPPLETMPSGMDFASGGNVAQWADVAFVVGLDGKVRDVQTLRTSSRVDSQCDRVPRASR